MQIFYHKNVESENYLVEEEARHASQVLRKKAGDIIFVTNGYGKLFECILTSTSKNRCDFTINKIIKNQIERRKIHIAVAPTKNIDRMEWMLEKCTEIGVNEFSFISTKRTERNKLNKERLDKIVISAMKQSVNFHLPTINDIVSFKEFINRTKDIKGEKFIAYVDNENQSTLFQLSNKKDDSIVLIGPEGDFTDDELKLAINNNFRNVSLGSNRLRTETACFIAAASLLIE